MHLQKFKTDNRKNGGKGASEEMTGNFPELKNQSLMVENTYQVPSRINKTILM